MEIQAEATDLAKPPPTAQGGRSVGRRAASGVVWVFLAVAATKVLGMGTYFVLARFLSPDEFGLVRFALILIGAFTILQDLGVPASIIHSDRDIKSISGTALTINVAASALLFGAAVLVAPYMASVAGDNAVEPVLIALAIGLVVLAFGSVQRAALEKELEFRRKFVPEVVPLIGSGVVSIALALLGFGAWSLVWGYLFKAVASSSLLWALSPVRPRFEFRADIARELFRYGKHMSLVSVIGFIGINADYFIVGHALGTYDLGLYTLAFLIANIPIQAIVEPVHKVMFPAYCRVRDDTEAVVSLYEKSAILVSMLTIPASLGIFIAGPVYVSIIFGQQWSGIGTPLQLLAVYTAMRSIYRGFASVFAAVGRPELVWRLNIFRLAILIPLMVLLVRQYGLVGIGIAYVFILAMFIPLSVYRLARALEVPIGRFTRLIAPQLAGLCLASLLVIVWNATPSLSMMSSQALGAVFLTLLSIGVYGVTATVLSPQIRTLSHDNPLFDAARRRSKR